MSDVRNSVSVETLSEPTSAIPSVGKGGNVSSIVKNSLKGVTDTIVTAQDESQNVEQVSINMPTFWEASENVIVGSSEWESLVSQLPTGKQAFVASYSQIYTAISQATALGNYDFSANSAHLDEMSDFLEKVSQEIEETIEQIYAEIRSMKENGDWDGEAYDAFYQKTLAYKEPLEQLVLLIKKFSGIFSAVGEETENLAKSITSVTNRLNE